MPVAQAFFVEDEVQVPAWPVTPPNDPAAIDYLSKALMETDYDIRAVLRLLFNSDFFKAAQFRKVKNPTEVVVSTLRLAGDAELPTPDIYEWANHITYMGQELLNPPSVEGWHSGVEWINSGALMKRTNFVADMVNETSRPGIRKIIEKAYEQATSPEALVDACLDLLGPLQFNEGTRAELVAHAEQNGVCGGNGTSDAESTQEIAEILQLIVSTREYMFA